MQQTNTVNNIVIIGLGKLGSKIAMQLALMGYQVTGVCRSKKPQRPPSNIEQINVDVSQPITHVGLQRALTLAQQVLVMLSPNDYTHTGYHSTFIHSAKNLIPWLNNNLQRLIFVSSTSVYGQYCGEVCDVSTLPSPNKFNGNVLLQAEQLWQQQLGDKLCVVRPSGIYGVQRLRLLRWLQTGKPVVNNHWTNRIMDVDLVNIINHLLLAPSVYPLYLATDYSPVKQHELLAWLANKLNLAMVRVDDAPETGKRLISNVDKNWLCYPTWQTGYTHILQSIEQPVNNLIK